jgi:hypothetical protein
MGEALLKDKFVPKYIEEGEPKFYRFLLFHALNKLVLMEQGFQKDGAAPHEALLDYHDQCLILYRREGEAHYLIMARIFRRAAHKMYRALLRKKLTSYNLKFLNSV